MSTTLLVWLASTMLWLSARVRSALDDLMVYTAEPLPSALTPRRLLRLPALEEPPKMLLSTTVTTITSAPSQ